MIAQGVAADGPMRAWSSSDPDPDGTLQLDLFDPSPAPPDPTALDADLCQHLVTGKYGKADALLGHPCDEELALMFRPILLFDTSERWRPLDVDRFLAEQVNGAPMHSVCNGPDLTLDCTPLTSTNLLAGSDTSSYLFVNSALTAQSPNYKEADFYRSPDPTCVQGNVLDCDSGPASAIYYHASPTTSRGYRYFDYWAFYRANFFGSDDIANDYNHQGNWEGVSIAPSKRKWGTFDFAAFSQHDGAWKSYLRANLTCFGPGTSVGCGTEDDPLGTNVVSYVANGDHANYPRSCSEVVFGACNQEDEDATFGGIPLPERGHDGAVYWSRNSDDDALLRMPEPGDGRPFDWSHFAGRWGVPASNDWGQGPESPMKQQHSVDPTFNECARDNGGCPLEATASARRQRSPRDRGFAQCDTWFGDDVQALVCIPSRLRAAVRRQQLGAAGSVRIVRATRRAMVARAAARRARAESAPGLAQRLGAPLRRGARLRITGRLVRGTQIRVHLAGNRVALLVVPRRWRGATLYVSRRGRPFLRLSNGRVVPPRQVRKIRP